MRLALFNKGRLGLVDGDDLVDVTDQLAGADTAGPAGMLQRYIETTADGQTVRLEHAGRPRIPLAEAALQAPLPRPGKIIGAPVNYLDHKAEMEYTTSVADLGVFLKANTSVIGRARTSSCPTPTSAPTRRANWASSSAAPPHT